MKAVGRIFDLFRDSPTFGRDRANLISGFSIGVVGLALNGAVLILMLPLMLDPDDRDFREITSNIEFGQLLALILLGGATAFATILIPFRLLTVFWGPRIGRYFDQIVLSGISPIRFVIGKVTSQNLFLALIFFLLLPYLILSLTLGGVDLGSFLAGLFLVWLYCMTLALVTIWASLYSNEGIAGACVIAGAGILGGLGCVPMTIQPFVMTPFPALIHPVYSNIESFAGLIPANFATVFYSCAGCMLTICAVSLFAISLGPLFGIIRENSTFGEVVRAGDSKRKRWFRLRLHIQRPSELAFFYENRSDRFVRNEGGIRWGISFVGMVLLLGIAQLTFTYVTSNWVVPFRTGNNYQWWIYEFHMIGLTIHGFALAIGALIFSHAMNSTYLKIPFLFGRKAEVSRLDTRSFVLFLLISTTAAIVIPFAFDRYVTQPMGNTVFPTLMYVNRGRPVDYVRLALEAPLLVAAAGLVIYAGHRYVCQVSWMRSVSFFAAGGTYFLLICMMPLFVAMLFMEIPELRQLNLFMGFAPTFAMISPITVMMFLFNEMGRRFPVETSTIPFYVSHGLLLGLLLIGNRRRARKLREMYLNGPTREGD